HEASCPAGISEGGIFREETVAGVDHARSDGLCRLDDRVDLQVAADGDGVVSELDMLGSSVRLGEDCDGLVAQLVASLDEPAGYFASIGDQDLHRCSGLTISRCHMRKTPNLV